MDPDAAAVLGAGDDLMAEDHRQLGRLDLVIAKVKIGAADGAGADLQQQLTVARFGVRDGRRS
jgi:hypothetical protein